MGLSIQYLVLCRSKRGATYVPINLIYSPILNYLPPPSSQAATGDRNIYLFSAMVGHRQAGKQSSHFYASYLAGAEVKAFVRRD